MGYSNTSKQMSVAQILRFVQNGEATFDNIIQRGFVWNAQQKSDLIYSLAMDIPIPPLYAQRTAVKENDEERIIYDVLDGKQRMNTIAQYLSGAFKLRPISPVTYIDAKKKKHTIDITGKKFDELPEMLKTIMKERTINMVVFDNTTKEELTTMFILLNNGKALSSKSKALAYCSDRENILKIGQHSLFSSMLTKKRRESKDEVTIISKMYIMLNDDIASINFRSSSLNAVMRDIKISKEDAKKLNKIFDYADDVYQILLDKNKKLGKTFIKEIHLVSLVPYIQKAIEKNISVNDFSQFIEKYFGTENEYNVSEAYAMASTQSVASPQCIQARDTELRKVFETEFK